MRELTAEEREALWRDGYVIIRAAVPRSLTARARAAIEAAEREGASPLGLGADPAMTDLVNHPASAVGDILRTTIGRFDPPTACQVAVRPVSQPSDSFVAPGYRERDLPYYGGAGALHMDGLATLPTPQEPVSGTPQEIGEWYESLTPTDSGDGHEITSKCAPPPTIHLFPLHHERGVGAGGRPARTARSCSTTRSAPSTSAASPPSSSSASTSVPSARRTPLSRLLSLLSGWPGTLRAGSVGGGAGADGRAPGRSSCDRTLLPQSA